MGRIRCAQDGLHAGLAEVKWQQGPVPVPRLYNATILRFSGRTYRQPRDVHAERLDGE